MTDNIDMVFTHNGGIAEGAAAALKESGRKDDVFLVSIGGRDSEKENIQAGLQDSTVVYPLTANEHILAAAKVCAGEPIPEAIVVHHSGLRRTMSIDLWAPDLGSLRTN